jgi:HK97 family phage portal protein
MKILGYEFGSKASQNLTNVDQRDGSVWRTIARIIREPFAGAWQRNMEVTRDEVLAFAAVYTCVSLIAQDIAKLRIKLVEQQDDGRWQEVTSGSPTFLPLLRKPCPYLNRITWLQYWITSKLSNGNAYNLKLRDRAKRVIGLYPLDPNRVEPMVSEAGFVFYRLLADNLSGITPFEDTGYVIVPADEIIHDMMPALFHPLVGVSPLFASGMASAHGIKIQQGATKFFANGARPGGVLTTEKEIKTDTAKRIKEYWDEGFTGDNAGKVAVLGDGLKYESMAVSAQASQLIEQLKYTAEIVCATFHVPTWKAGFGTMPAYGNVESANQDYYSTCLQAHIESIELALDEGLDLNTGEANRFGIELDLSGLLRMDTKSRYESHTAAIQGHWKSPNEVRRDEDLPPVTGGESPLAQQQDYNLADLAKLRKQEFAKPPAPALPAPGAQPPSGPAANDPNADPAAAAGAKEIDEFQREGLLALMTKELRRQPA